MSFRLLTDRVGENGYVADVLVGIRKKWCCCFVRFNKYLRQKITEAPVTMASQDDSQRRQETSVEDIISQNSEKSIGIAKNNFQRLVLCLGLALSKAGLYP